LKRLAFALLFVSSLAHAQAEAETTRLFAEGQTLMNEGHLREACVKFEGSLKAGGGIGTMLYLGSCYERTGRASSAYAMYSGAASLAHQRKDSREPTAVDLAEKIRPRVSWLVLHFAKPREPSFELRQDQSLVGDAELDKPIPADPGEHVLEARAPGKTMWTSSFKIDGEGLTANVSVPELADAPKPKPIVVTKTSGTTQRVIGGAIAGVGLASIIVGSVFGAIVVSRQNETTTPGNPHYCDDNAKPMTCVDGTSFRQDTLTLAHVTDVTIAVGAAAIIGGAIVFLVAPKKSNVVAGPHGLTWRF
jgi:hypothetical protein